MDQIQLVINQLLKMASQPHGSPTNNDTLIAPSISATLPMKDISLGFRHYDGTTLVMEWTFNVEFFFLASSSFSFDVLSFQELEFLSLFLILVDSLQSFLDKWSKLILV